KPLKGRFVHLTDLHPDPFYHTGGAESKACHFKKKRKRHRAENGSARKAGYWGLPVSECDSPLTLVNATFDWLGEHFRDEVDFVVWTGDNARHGEETDTKSRRLADIDTRLPRTLPEILDLNRYVADRIRQTFGKDVPVVASIGNNDIYPHNVLAPGPNKITNEYLDVWSHFIPEHFQHTFARGGYYSVEAVKGDLLLVSLNTLYFYDRNAIVDGSRNIDPGTEQLLWLEQQLTLARAQGMQVWLTGHVPATKDNWYPGCYEQYAELVLGWQDTIVGQLFGHMNVDFVSFISDADTPSLSSSSPPTSRNSLVPPAAEEDDEGAIRPLANDLAILNGLEKLYSSLPPEHKLHERDYVPVHVNPSVIPTYLPSIRVWEYNTT
ncbi:hypothetical protein RHOSPDRAFT_13083, partial [Rhodotorula sp. JG-1b]